MDEITRLQWVHEVVDKATRQSRAITDSMIRDTQRMTAAAREQATVHHEVTTRVIQDTAQEKQAWRQMYIAAARLDREMAQSAIGRATKVSQAAADEVAAMVRAGATYRQVVDAARRGDLQRVASVQEAAAAVKQASAQQAQAMADHKRLVAQAVEADRAIARAATEREVEVSGALNREIVSLRRTGTTYEEMVAIAREGNLSRASSYQEAAVAIERAAARERAAVTSTATASAKGAAGAGLAAGAGADVRRGGGYVRMGAGLLGLGAVFEAGSKINDAIEYEHTLARVQANAEASTKQVAEMKKQVFDLGSTLGVGAHEGADGLYELSKAGFHTDQIIEALAPTMKLAKVGMLDLATAAHAMHDSVLPFQMDAKQSAHVADVLSIAMHRSKATVEDIGNSLGYVSAIAHGANQTFDTTVGLLTSLGRGGLVGSRAGTGLRRVIINLQNLNKTRQAVLDELGVKPADIYESDGKGGFSGLKQLPDVLDVLFRKLKQFDGVKQTELLDKFFGVYGAESIQVLRNQGIPQLRASIKEYEAASKGVGAATKMTDEFLDNAKGSMMKFSASVENAAVVLLERYQPSIQHAAEASGKWIKDFAADGKNLDEVDEYIHMIIESAGDFVHAVEPAAKVAVGAAKAFNDLPDPVKSAAIQFVFMSKAIRALSETAAIGALTRGFKGLRSEMAAVEGQAVATNAAIVGGGALRGGEGVAAIGIGERLAASVRSGIFSGRGVGALALGSAAGVALGGGSVLGGAASGAAGGLMFGPWGAAIGGLAGAAATEIANVLTKHHRDEVEKAARRFANDVASRTEDAVAAGMTHAQAHRVAQTGAKLAQDGRQANDGRHLVTAIGSSPQLADMFGVSGDEAIAKYREFLDKVTAEVTKHQKAWTATLTRRGDESVVLPRYILDEFKRSYGQLPPVARQKGAQAMLEFAAGLERQGRMTQMDLAAVIRSLAPMLGGLDGDAKKAGHRVVNEYLAPFGLMPGAMAHLGRQSMQQFIANAKSASRSKDLLDAARKLGHDVQTNFQYGMHGLPALTAKTLQGMVVQIQDNEATVRKRLRGLEQSLNNAHGPEKTLIEGQITKARQVLDDYRGMEKQLMDELRREIGTGASASVDALRKIRNQVKFLGGDAQDLAKVMDGTFTPKRLRWLQRVQDVLRPELHNPLYPLIPGDGSVAGAIPGAHRKRAGGRIGFASGGMVPAAVSPGELVVYGNSSWTVPGLPIAADSVYADLPVGAMVFTGHGQSLLAAGASPAEALAYQRPHFRVGGPVERFASGGIAGRYEATAYGPPWDAMEGSGTTATGIKLPKSPTGRPGPYIAAVDPSVIPLHTRFTAHPNPFGYSGAWQAEDTGGAIKGHRIDFLDMVGRAHQNEWGRREVTVRRASDAAAKISSGDLTRMIAAAVSHAKTANLLSPGLPDAFDQGFAAGQAGSPLFRGRWGADTDLFKQAVQGMAPTAADLPKKVSVNVPGFSRGDASHRFSGLPTAWRGLGKDGLHAGIKRAAGLVMGRYKDLEVTSTTHGGHVANSYHYQGKAVDISGPDRSMLNASGWIRNQMSPLLLEGIHNPNLAVKNGRVYQGQGPFGNVWAEHKNHIHLAVDSFRRGGIARRRPFATGGVVRPAALAAGARRQASASASVEQLASLVGQITGVPIRATAQAVAIARTIAGQLAHATDAQILAEEARIRQEIATLNRGGATGVERVQIRRLRSALSLMDAQIGARIGAWSQLAQDVTAHAGDASKKTQRYFTASGLDPNSSLGFGLQAAGSRIEAQRLVGARDEITKAIRQARRAHQPQKVRDLIGQRADIKDQLADARANYKAQIRGQAAAGAQERVDTSQFGVDWHNANTQLMEAQQRVRGVANTPQALLEQAQASRASVPLLKGLHDSLLKQANTLFSQGDMAGYRQAMLGAEQASTDMANAMADATDKIHQAAMQAASDALAHADHAVTMAQGREAGFEIQQHIAELNGTGPKFDSPQAARARADNIRQQIIPTLQADLKAALDKELADAANGADQATRDQDAEKALNVQNAIQQAQLDALNDIKQATQGTEQNTKPTGGALSTTYREQRYTDRGLSGALAGV